MLYFTCDSADVSYEKELKAAKIIWKQNSEDVNKFFLIQSKAFVLLKDKHCKNWISDFRNKHELSFKETEWLRRFMLPQAIEYKVNKIAFVINKSDEAAIRKQAIINTVKDKLNLKFFTDSESADKWVKD